MNKVVSIYEAKTNLSKLIKRAKAGETIYVGSYGEAEAVIAPMPKIKQPIKFGLWKDNPKLAYKDEDFVGVDPEIQEMFYGKDWDK